MLSLAWLTVFIIFVYVPGLTLNAIESSATQSLSGSGSEAQSDTSAALVAPSLVRGDDFANEKQFLRTNKPAEANAINISTTSATQTSAQLPTLVSGNAHSVTKDPSPSPPSSSSSSASSSSLSSSLLKIQLTQVTTSTTEATTTTALKTTSEPAAAAAASTTTTTTATTRRATTARTWGILNDIEGRNNNGQRSGSDYDQLPSSEKQIQHQQHYQHERHEAQLAMSATQYTFATNPTPFPLQLTETIQNTARVITRGNGLNWVYTGLASSESPSVIQTRSEIATRPPLPVISPSPSSASFMLSLSGAALSVSVSPATTVSPSSSVAGLSSSTLPFLSTSTNSSTTTFSPATSTTTLSPSLSSLDGYLNITSQAGTHAYLPCNVKQLVKKPISWLRVRDGHILTVDQTTFIADQRFQSIYTPNPERWSLQIKYVQTKDAGTYECQVSTEPKTSAIVSLNIVEPKTELIGESNRHVKAGSQVKLRCIISQALEPPLFINWYHNRKQIYLHNRKGWRTEIERDAAGNVTTDKQITIASLIIPSVSKKDSGNYTCSPSNSEPITVVLHVLNGEYSASAITSGSRRTSIIDRGLCQMLLLQHTLLWVISFLMYFGQLRHHHSRLLPQDITMN